MKKKIFWSIHLFVCGNSKITNIVHSVDRIECWSALFIFMCVIVIHNSLGGNRGSPHHWTTLILTTMNQVQRWYHIRAGRRIHWRRTVFRPQKRRAVERMHQRQQLLMVNWQTTHQLFPHFEFVLMNAIDCGLWTLVWPIYWAAQSKFLSQR